MAEPNTHLAISPRLCGEPVTLEEGRAVVRLKTLDEMRADAQGLVHGGFVFGAVDYAAMLAVNDPNVVLGSADVRFTAPVKVGDEVEATAERVEQSGKKHRLEVRATVGDREVLKGTLTAFVLDAHVLEG
ncbi:MAG TPA: hotdog domain-containing protein [Sandaracinaceae bacterium LLY-WYZ-13_1]|nr:hotdog domain-containing protein [Sandaracinaceae bacterium LLY-WYZ-13_1]